MNIENQDLKYHNNNTFGVVLGVLLGGLAGAVTMLLLAPQSGKDTRIQLQKKGIELRDRTSAGMKDAMARVRSGKNKLSMGGHQKAKELLQHGQTLVVEQLDHVSDAALAGKKAIQNF